jgi:hypothetical protein
MLKTKGIIIFTILFAMTGLSTVAASTAAKPVASSDKTAVKILSAITVDGNPIYDGKNELTGDNFLVEGTRIVLFTDGDEETFYTLTKSVTIPTERTLVVEAGSNLLIERETVLSIDDGGSLINRGVVVIPEDEGSFVQVDENGGKSDGKTLGNAEIVINGNFDSVGEVACWGKLRVTETGSLFTNGKYRGGALIEKGGRFNNLGELYIDGGKSIIVDGEFLNGIEISNDPDGEAPVVDAMGTVYLTEGNSLIVGETGRFINKGVLENGGRPRVYAVPVSEPEIENGGDITVDGEMFITESMINCGTVTIEPGGLLAFHRYLNNKGTIEVGGALHFNGNEFINNGTINTHGDFNVASECFSISGTLNITGGSVIIGCHNVEVTIPEKGYPTIKIGKDAIYTPSGELPNESGVYQYIKDVWVKK